MIPLLLVLLQLQANPILGRWEGNSTCLKASGNAACHDEVVRYDLEHPAARGDTIVIHAFKQVGDAWDWMGDLGLTFDSTGHRWVGEFANGRVHIEWSYWLAGDELHGQLVDLPGRRKTRDVVVRRVAAP